MKKEPTGTRGRTRATKGAASPPRRNVSAQTEALENVRKALDTAAALRETKPAEAARYDVRNRESHTPSDSMEAARVPPRRSRARKSRAPDVDAQARQAAAAGDRMAPTARVAVGDDGVMRTEGLDEIALLMDDSQPWLKRNAVAADLFRTRMDEAGGIGPPPSPAHPERYALMEAILRNQAADPTWDRARADTVNIALIEAVPRAYEERYLYQPTGAERECIKGDACLCKEWFGFILKEFLLPQTERDNARTGSRDAEARECILCLREQALFLIVMRMVNDLEPRPDLVLQTHRNLVNEPGEYNVRDCLPLNTNRNDGLAYPIVMNNKLYFSPCTGPNQVRYLRQTGYALGTVPIVGPQDFCDGVSRKALLLPAPSPRPADTRA